MKPKKVFTDTTDFYSIDGGDEIQLPDRCFIVTGHEKERRFGIEDPKFWVKRAYDKESGERKIIKLSFLETFETAIGSVKVRCFRDPEKEGQILELVKDHPFFMHGTVYRDEKNNNVRVLDIVRGPNFFVNIDSYRMKHEKYFHEELPKILAKLLKAIEAIRFLHLNGFQHGDIRNDHLYCEQSTGNYVWIDFDYDYDAQENPFGLDIFGLGNILLYSVGKGFHNLYMIDNDRHTYGDLMDSIVMEDLSILDKSRLVNLRKLYPYIPRMLNNMLMHFSRCANLYYEFIDELIEDLGGYLQSL